MSPFKPGPKLGKLRPKISPKTLKLEKYIDASILPPLPERVFREWKVPGGGWGLMLNSEIGCCTIAAIAHMEMLMTEHTGALVRPTDDEVLAAYSVVSGYDPKTGLNDNGAAITDVLNFWQTQGLSGHKILGWASVDHTNLDAVKHAIHLFGAVNLGVQLPQSAMDQTNNKQPWEVASNDGGILGGHAICNFGFGSEGTNCITWGQRQEMSFDWLRAYADECYAVISQDFINQATQLSPGGFDLPTLIADLKLISA